MPPQTYVWEAFTLNYLIRGMHYLLTYLGVVLIDIESFSTIIVTIVNFAGIETGQTFSDDISCWRDLRYLHARFKGILASPSRQSVASDQRRPSFRRQTQLTHGEYDLSLWPGNNSRITRVRNYVLFRVKELTAALAYPQLNSVATLFINMLVSFKLVKVHTRTHTHPHKGGGGSKTWSWNIVLL